MSSELELDIKASIADIEKLLSTYSALFNFGETAVPDAVELAALAAVLHSFYNGIEGIFTHIAKRYDGGYPETSMWHRDLLKSMMCNTPNRQAVLLEDTANQLARYMQFRHFFRHAYSFMLSWDKIKPLAVEVNAVWALAKRDILRFGEEMADNGALF